MAAPADAVHNVRPAAEAPDERQRGWRALDRAAPVMSDADPAQGWKRPREVARDFHRAPRVAVEPGANRAAERQRAAAFAEYDSAVARRPIVVDPHLRIRDRAAIGPADLPEPFWHRLGRDDVARHDDHFVRQLTNAARPRSSRQYGALRAHVMTVGGAHDDRRMAGKRGNPGALIDAYVTRERRTHEAASQCSRVNRGVTSFDDSHPVHRRTGASHVGARKGSDAEALARAQHRVPCPFLRPIRRGPDPPTAYEMRVDPLGRAKRLDLIDRGLGSHRQPHGLAVATQANERVDLRPPREDKA